MSVAAEKAVVAQRRDRIDPRARCDRMKHAVSATIARRTATAAKTDGSVGWTP